MYILNSELPLRPTCFELPLQNLSFDRDSILRFGNFILILEKRNTNTNIIIIIIIITSKFGMW